VLLGDGYIIDIYSKENTKGRKAYRSDSDRSTFIEMNVVCVDEPDGSMVYANGLLSTYDIKRSSGSASVGVSAFGSVSLPFGQSVDSMVKISDETIRDREFYRRFFNALNIVMARINKVRQNAAQQTERALSRQQKQGKSSLGENSQMDSPNLNPAEPAAEELAPMPPVEPARTAEALDESQAKQPEDPDAAEAVQQTAGENPAAASPMAPVESVLPANSATPEPASP
jgi:hypothetical protein